MAHLLREDEKSSSRLPEPGHAPQMESTTDVTNDDALRRGNIPAKSLSLREQNASFLSLLAKPARWQADRNSLSVRKSQISRAVAASILRNTTIKAEAATAPCSPNSLDFSQHLPGASQVRHRRKPQDRQAGLLSI